MYKYLIHVPTKITALPLVVRLQITLLCVPCAGTNIESGMCSRLVVTMPMMTSVQYDRQTPWEVQYLVVNPSTCNAVTVVRAVCV